MESLVIVESQAKAETLAAILGAGYRVLSTGGHLIDLPKSRLGVAVEGNFEPEYITVRGRAVLLKELCLAATKASKVYLAMDNDREGEAMAYLLAQAFLQKRQNLIIERIVFGELQAPALAQALASPRPFDLGLVGAQKARRVLDRLVGYSLSPVLWKTVKSKLSAGRIQSAALRLICDREDLVELHVPRESWTLEVEGKQGRWSFCGILAAYRGKEGAFASKAEAQALLTSLATTALRVKDVWKVDTRREPEPPFTTSTLLQAASSELGFSAKKTMQIASQLYEGLEVEGRRQGLITFPRSDSTRLGPEALEDARAYVSANFPLDLPELPRLYRPGKASLDSHEALRPCKASWVPETLKPSLTKDQYRLYALIWERFVASQMDSCRLRTTEVEALAGEALFRMTSVKLMDRGFYKLKRPRDLRARIGEALLPDLKVGQTLGVSGYRLKALRTEGPQRFTEASFVRALEDKGLGRPSTYAPILSVLLDRWYVGREGGELKPTVLGRRVNEVLAESFSEFIDPAFTASLESRLDEVEAGSLEWPGLVASFYRPFRRRLEEVEAQLGARPASPLDEASGRTCEVCGKPMVKRLGRRGYFLACSGFPGCTATASLPLGSCPRCGQGDLVARKGPGGRGKEFYACSRYPECGFFTYYRPTSQACPGCGLPLVEKSSKKRGTFKACINPRCEYLHEAGDKEGQDLGLEAVHG